MLRREYLQHNLFYEEAGTIMFGYNLYYLWMIDIQQMNLDLSLT